ncbi:PQQ-dependent sugar dehydrogenase [Acinetobacter sp. YH12134]|uniref:PQQ-dependent sugar dehydrogenase n=1 Tax=Acinetobacter sp. YH12134 TaxID=2601118 RepID=UPI0015D3D122|nr:PQQ-dependent sugar dehydrogenase [Acinetobacter sp. YH12134]
MAKLQQYLTWPAALLIAGLTTGCNAQTEPANSAKAAQSSETSKTSQSYQLERVARLQEPWAMAELPDGRLLITEKRGRLKLFNPSNKLLLEVKGVPKVAYGGQGGLGDVALHPQFAQNRGVYLSYVEAGTGGYGAVVARAELDLKDAAQPQLKNVQQIWGQVPKIPGQGHYAHRLLFDQAGYLWVSSGERQKFDPAQDLNSNLGKILRLNADGSAAPDNPFRAQGQIAAQVWSLGHRNPLGMAFDPAGQLWVIEMGPKGGDELNRIEKGANYGYPIVSNGDHYSGQPIPDHATRPEFKAPELDWTPVISPSSLIFYRGDQFPQWKNKAIAGGLSSQAIIVIDTQAQPVREVQRLDMKQRIRGVIEARDGHLWAIEDGKGASLLKMTAK